MACMELKELYKQTQTRKLQIGALDIIRFVCNCCQSKEVCPAVSEQEYDAAQLALETSSSES